MKFTNLIFTLIAFALVSNAVPVNVTPRMACPEAGESPQSFHTATDVSNATISTANADVGENGLDCL